MSKALTSEIFTKLLRAFSADETEAALGYKKLRDALVRYFRLKGLAEADEAADATIDRLAVKINQNTSIEDLNRYTLGIAKKVFLEKLRHVRIEKRANDVFYLKSEAFREQGEPDHLEPLRECLKSLYDDERKLLMSYFADLPANELFENRQNLADREKVTLNTLRNRISRLRKRLEDCLREVL